MKIIKSKINNQTIPIVLNQNGIPEYLILRYLILFQKGKSYRTKYITCKSYILFLQCVKNYNKTNLQEIIISGDFTLIKKTIINFSSWLSINTDSAININIYLYSIKNFLKWSLNVYNKKVDNYEFSIIELIKIQLTRNNLSAKKTDYNINDKIIEAIFSITSLNSKNNPFNLNKTRNHLIMKIFIETGIRLGELLNLKISDFIRHENQFYINISYSNEEFDDERWNPPSLKNSYSQRFLGISPETYLLYEKYLKYYRIKSVNKFLFTSNKGLPLSKSMLNKIFIDISSMINYKITPHLLRHYFATKMLFYLIEIKKIDMERAKDELRAICGWSINSNMPLLYTKKYIENIANINNIERLTNIRDE